MSGIKKVLVFVVACVLASVFGGCSQLVNPDDGKIHIVTSNFPCYDIARRIGGERVDICMLIPPGSESHSFEPSTSDIIRISSCDLFICVGGESDKWLDKILDSVRENSSFNVLKLMDCTRLLEEEHTMGMKHDESDYDDHHDHHNESESEYDEHVWTSLRNTSEMSEYIKDKLSEIDTEGASYYEANCEQYKAELNALDTEFVKLFENAENTVMVFGDRFPLRYFTEDYGIEYYAAFPGCAAQTEPDIATIAFLVDKIREEDIRSVFYIDMSNTAMVKSISEETGAFVRCFYSCHNVTQTQFDNGDTYLDLMKENLKTLKEVFSE